jgi:hypothetical protein
LHFAIEQRDGQWSVVDLDSTNGTWRNGERISFSILQTGDRIRAGDIELTVRVIADDPSPVASLTDWMRGQTLPLFGLFDAARSAGVLTILRQSSEPLQSLYEAEVEEELSDVAPYLAVLRHSSPVLEAALKQGWLDWWGIYFISEARFDMLLKHFRSFQIVRDETGRQMYFRFYDPRVLRAYLPACTSDERSRFFGPVAAFLVASEQGEILEFHRNGTCQTYSVRLPDESS